MYVTPIQIDPESPALPISHPAYYAAYLAKLLGSFATVGMAEDTWALNEGVIDEAAFLDQAYRIQDEREAMFENALAHSTRGVVACVFDTSDRVQHMFSAISTANPARAGAAPSKISTCAWIVWPAKPCSMPPPDTVLFVLSDHGFCSFRRAVNLNSWLHQNGYLALNRTRQPAGGILKASTGAGRGRILSRFERPLSQHGRPRGLWNRETGAEAESSNAN